MPNCDNKNLRDIPADVYICNTKIYPQDEKAEKLVNMIFKNEGGYNLCETDRVSGETYLGMDRKNGDEKTEIQIQFWKMVDDAKKECFSNGTNIVPYAQAKEYFIEPQSTADFQKQYAGGNKKVKNGTHFTNEYTMKELVKKNYIENYYKKYDVYLINNPMICAHTFSQATHYGPGGEAWLEPLLKAINAVCGTNFKGNKLITQEILNYVNSDKACDIANKYTQYRREKYARSKQTWNINGWLNMVNNCVKYVNANFK